LVLGRKSVKETSQPLKLGKGKFGVQFKRFTERGGKVKSKGGGTEEGGEVK